jgi:hydrogenase-4 transcriptional activator
MEPFRGLLLSVWKETCRHIEIQEAAGNIAVMLAQQMPLSAVLVRRLDPSHHSLRTVARAEVDDWLPAIAETTALSVVNYKKVVAWARSGQSLHKSRRHTPRELSLILPEEIDSELLIAALGEPKDPHGVLILVAELGKHFDATHLRMLEALREPFTAALENDHRVHELAALRDVAEAEKQALLTRLGRREVSDAIVGADSGLRPVMERVEMVAKRDVPVLILGETGTGKEVVARAIHTRSARASGPFMRVNCGAIPSELIDSQLFGHEKGSFTGASDMRQGWFERADGGTLFLDEIGELPLQAQVRLLRVLQDGFLERVGGHQSIRVDVRIVAATHRDLATMVHTKEFREDLWYRLAVFPILLPALRDRKGDIPALARHFAERAAMRFGLPLVMPTESDIALLSNYSWPGNIRELGSVIDRAAILGEGRTLEIAKALGVISPGASAPSNSNTAPQAAAPTKPAESPQAETIATLDEAMRAHITKALAYTRGRIEGPKGAAAILDINPHTLRARMRKLKINWSEYRGD